MKKITLFLILTSIFSCNYLDNNKSNNLEIINLSIKDKQINRFFLGNEYYGYKGIKSNDSISSYKFKKTNSYLILKMKNRFISPGKISASQYHYKKVTRI